MQIQILYLGANSVTKALPIENVIRVEGNVYNPGLVAYEKGHDNVYKQSFKPEAINQTA